MATPAADSAALTGNSLIDGLLQGGSWILAGSRTLTYSLNVNDNGAGGRGPGGDWTSALSDAMTRAVTSWSDVANISFQQIVSGTYYFQSEADIAATLTGDELQQVGAIALGIFPDPDVADVLLAEIGATRATYPRPEGDVAFDNYFPGYQHLSDGGVGFETMVHELGHALGLKHPSDDGGNGRPTFTELGISEKDLERFTIMSTSESNASLTSGHAASPMTLDILAIQSIYGANLSHHSSDDTYVVVQDGALRTIWDAGGIDTLDASALSAGVTLDLRPGSILDLGADTVLGVAYACVIENAIGGAGNDTLWGNDAGNVLIGNEGSDTLFGGAGNDTYWVWDALDVIAEDPGDGTDLVLSRVNYVIPANVEDLTLEATAGSINGTGNDADNTITGNGASNTLEGGNGADHLLGGSGNDRLAYASGLDTLDGGNGSDTASFSAFDAAVSVNLEYGGNEASTRDQPHLASGTWRSIANLVSIEHITGTAYADSLTGSAGNNRIDGGGGNDRLYYTNGLDTLDGGAGGDTADYSVFGTAVSVNLSYAGYEASTRNLPHLDSGAWRTIADLSDIEHVTGTAYADRLTGNGGNNLISGGDGNDRVSYTGGLDTLDGGHGGDTADFSAFGAAVSVNLAYSGYEAYTRYQANLDSGAWRTIADLVSIEHLTGSAYADRLMGDGGNNVIAGGGGNDRFSYTGGLDTMDGGAGSDTADFTAFGSAVSVNLGYAGYEAHTRSGPDLDGGTWRTIADLVSIENLSGSVYADRLTGDAGKNVLDGAGGSDVLTGSDGADTLVGGANRDTLTGGSGADRFDFTVLPSASTNVDLITDYSLTDDLIGLDRDVFTAFATENGPIGAAAFYSGAGAAAGHDADDHVVYDTATGNLYYDPDGSGGTGATLFANLPGAPALDVGDFFITA